MTPRARDLAIVILGCGLLLGACNAAPAPGPTATVHPTATTAPTAAVATAAVPSPTASTTPFEPVASATPAATTPSGDELPPGWERHGNDELSIAIPPGWRVIDVDLADAQGAYDTLARDYPGLGDILGGPEALAGAAFWAFGPVVTGKGQASFVDNMNVRRSPLGAQRIASIQEVIDVLLPEYEKLGLVVTSTDPALRIDGFPAGRITYTLATNTDAQSMGEIRGRQYLVATDADLWVLSYTTVPKREGALAAGFETSAQSFEPK